MEKWIFKVGEVVSFLNETGSGIILKKLQGNKYSIQDEDGFEEVYDENDLVIPFSKMENKEIVESATNEAVVAPVLPKECWEGICEYDTVRPLDDEGEGVVKSISKSGVFSVELNIGLTIDYHRHELVKVGKEFDNSLLASVDKKDNVLKTADFEKKVQAKKTDRKNEGVWEVDLHVHEITEETDFLGPGELLQIQMDHFELKLNEAIDRKVRKVIFIHGRGKGKLKNEIRAMLTRYPQCEYHDGNFHRYGQGATEVWIYNKSN